MTNIFDYKFQILKQELETVQTGIDIYNRTLFTIKGWAITLFTGFMIFIAQYKKTGDFVILAMGVVIVLFWIQDAMFKSLQKVYIERSGEIETYLKSVNFENDLAAQNFNSGEITFPEIETKLGEWKEKLFAEATKEFFTPTIILTYLPLIGLLVWFILRSYV